MPRTSSIKRLPPEIRELIGKLRTKHSRTIDEIMEKLRELEIDVSRSALGRYTKEIDAIAEEVQRNRTIAEALVERFGERPDNKAARMNIELMHALITRLMFGEDGRAVQLDAQEAYFLGTALQRLSQAQKLDSERMVKLKQEAEKAANKKAADAAAGAAKKAGLSAEAIAMIERDVLGIAS